MTLLFNALITIFGYNSRMNKMRICYILNYFPVVSETFIVNEIAAMLERGIDVRILCCHRIHATLNHPKSDEICNRVHYISDHSVTILEKVTQHLLSAVLSPVKYWKEFFSAIIRLLRCVSSVTA